MENLIRSLTIILVLSSCTSENNNVLEGTYKDINDKSSQTLIKKISENEYEVIAEFDPSFRFTAKRKKIC